MRPNKVKQFWKEGKPLAMGWLGSPDTYIVEAMANSGFDVLTLDMQHGMGIGPDRAVIAIQTINTTDTPADGAGAVERPDLHPVRPRRWRVRRDRADGELARRS